MKPTVVVDSGWCVFRPSVARATSCIEGEARISDEISKYREENGASTQ